MNLGKVKVGQVKSGQDKLGQVKSVQVNLGQFYLGLESYLLTTFAVWWLGEWMENWRVMLISAFN